MTLVEVPLERFAQLPVTWRAAAAADAIYRDMGMTIEQRGELLALAIWPSGDAASTVPIQVPTQGVATGAVR